MISRQILQEISRHEARFRKIDFKNGLMLAKSARDYYAELLVCHEKVSAGAKTHSEAKAKLAKLEAEAAKARRHGASVPEIVRLRRIVKSGEYLIKKEHIFRMRLEEKIKALSTM